MKFENSGNVATFTFINITITQTAMCPLCSRIGLAPTHATSVGTRPLYPLDWEGDSMELASPPGARKSPGVADSPVGAVSAGYYSWAGSKNPPTRVCPSHHHPARACALCPRGAGRLPTGTQNGGGWGSGSPLTRAFAGSKPHTHILPLTRLCATYKAQADWPLSSETGDR
jgi:hypothetical protein